MEARHSSQQEAPCRYVVQSSCIALEHSAVERLISAFPFHHSFFNAPTYAHTFLVTKETIQTNGDVETYHSFDHSPLIVWRVCFKISFEKKADFPALWTKPLVSSLMYKIKRKVKLNGKQITFANNCFMPSAIVPREGRIKTQISPDQF